MKVRQTSKMSRSSIDIENIECETERQTEVGMS